jgi:O-antigen/teichoic acid export membrane protein
MNLEKRFLRAYSWSIGSKLVVRSLGLLSTLVLVRVLTPSDFGVIAIASMIIGFSVILSGVEANRFLILNREIKEIDFSKYWTLSILFRFLFIILLYFFAPYVSIFMDDDRLTLVIRLLALVQVLDALNNVGMVTHQRALNFAPENKISIVAKVFSSIVTIIFTLILQSYFALIIGIFVNSLVVLFGTYVASTFRPKLDFRLDWKMFVFSKFVMLRNILGYTRAQLDTLLVGRLFGSSVLGNYKVASQFGILAQTELVTPAIQPAFSGLSTLKDDKKRLHEKVYQSFFLSFLFVIPAAFGMFFIAEPFVFIVLGDQWQAAIPMIQVLGFLMLPFSTQPILSMLYDLEGKTKVSIFSDIYGIVALLISIWMLKPNDGDFFAEIRVLVGFSTLLVGFALGAIFLGLQIKKLAVVTFYPTAFSLLMFFILTKLEVAHLPNVIQVVISLILGSSVYLLAIVSFVNILSFTAKKGFVMRLFPEALLKVTVFKYRQRLG